MIFSFQKFITIVVFLMNEKLKKESIVISWSVLFTNMIDNILIFIQSFFYFGFAPFSLPLTFGFLLFAHLPILFIFFCLHHHFRYFLSFKRFFDFYDLRLRFCSLLSLSLFICVIFFLYRGS